MYEYWKSVPIAVFTVKMIDDYYDWLVTECKAHVSKHNPGKGKYVSASVANNIHKILRCAFNQTKKRQYISL